MLNHWEFRIGLLQKHSLTYSNRKLSVNNHSQAVTFRTLIICSTFTCGTHIVSVLMSTQNSKQKINNWLYIYFLWGLSFSDLLTVHLCWELTCITLKHQHHIFPYFLDRIMIWEHSALYSRYRLMPLMIPSSPWAQLYITDLISMNFYLR